MRSSWAAFATAALLASGTAACGSSTPATQPTTSTAAPPLTVASTPTPTAQSLARHAERLSARLVAAGYAVRASKPWSPGGVPQVSIVVTTPAGDRDNARQAAELHALDLRISRQHRPETPAQARRVASLVAAMQGHFSASVTVYGSAADARSIRPGHGFHSDGTPVVVHRRIVGTVLYSVTEPDGTGDDLDRVVAAAGGR